MKNNFRVKCTIFFNTKPEIEKVHSKGIKKLINNKNIHHEIAGQVLSLLSQKAIYWQNKKALLVADLHFGKAGHFRKAGIPIPKAVHDNDYARLENIIENNQPDKVIFLGDLFHSDLNEDWWEFTEWLNKYPDIDFHLIMGNHDILPKAAYEQSRLLMHQEKLALYPFLLTHEPLEENLIPEGFYSLSGHIHPAVKLQGPARQQITLPCFYFGLHGGILPAFGKFTGFAQIKVKNSDSIFVVLNEKVIRLR